MTRRLSSTQKAERNRVPDLEKVRNCFKDHQLIPQHELEDGPHRRAREGLPRGHSAPARSSPASCPGGDAAHSCPHAPDSPRKVSDTLKGSWRGQDPTCPCTTPKSADTEGLPGGAQVQGGCFRGESHLPRDRRHLGTPRPQPRGTREAAKTPPRPNSGSWRNPEASTSQLCGPGCVKVPLCLTFPTW